MGNGQFMRPFDLTRETIHKMQFHLNREVIIIHLAHLVKADFYYTKYMLGLRQAKFTVGNCMLIDKKSGQIPSMP